MRAHPAPKNFTARTNQSSDLGASHNFPQLQPIDQTSQRKTEVGGSC